jgi:hypothetical protein
MGGPICESHPDRQGESSQVLGISLEEQLKEQGQSSNLPDNQAANPNYLQGKSEGQPSEDTFTGWAGVITARASHLVGVPELVSAGVTTGLSKEQSSEQLRRERPFGPSHIVEGGGDASQVKQIQEPEYARSHGPSHVAEGGGDA